ncbi:pseudouridine synthase [Dyella sp. A6]|uniref:pseudouridine synthase n=1 Tax=Dyella aluminiiresistens TaxID=3069105 RepID=UPI002E773E9E|nr:pseudouridine synthase [Dyella sp. A6]
MPAIAPSTFHLPPGPWATVLDGLCAHFPAIGRERWLDRMARGRVLDSAGLPVVAQTRYRAGLCVRYWREVTDEPRIPFDEAIVHLDRHLLVADKPPFLPVTPAGRFVEETLLTRLIRRTGHADLVPLHRIDRLTSGLVLFSVDPGSRAAYQALFRERRIAKHYEALAPPLPDQSFPLLRRSRIEPGEPFFRMREADGEPNSETRIDVIGRGQHDWHYALYPVTGRKHQLRVQMAGLGAPIRHDPLYPELAAEAPDDPDRPLQLLARTLAFNDPLSGEQRHFESTRVLEIPRQARSTLS